MPDTCESLQGELDSIRSLILVSEAYGAGQAIELHALDTNGPWPMPLTEGSLLTTAAAVALRIGQITSDMSLMNLLSKYASFMMTIAALGSGRTQRYDIIADMTEMECTIT